MSLTLHHKVHIHLEYCTVYVPSLELGPLETTPIPSPRSECALPPEPKGGAHSPAGEGLGESQFQRREKKLSTLFTLWSPRST
jgi:hypothetical protein